ncbi:sigma-70 family RNA polymerase sigma factor [Iningainema tapete]|uniref:Sigma-70 family RNA polymerase sigma factor n=1 Tax=Iningainema tapete BLCC-T55 TaxID=2748662 RepID=A0A8J6XN44_9CYAN|nr:sigma-70 family RNA polymerase sigma factor [Iningainema tapete]MBD2774985.1 sigma-70 family RNA polymerase sigma factor [Iningainema tapete BLCC-T55]
MGDVLDDQLRRLVSEAQQHPPNSTQQRRALNRLIKKIQESGKLNRFVRWQNLPDFEDIYHEAQAKTFTEICKKIHKYEPEYKVMAWVNQILEWRFLDVLRQIINRPRTFSLDELNSINNDADSHASKESSRVQKEILEKGVSENHQKTEDELLREFINSDPKGILQNTFIGEDKNANLQKVLLMRLNEEKWSDISKKLGHPIPRLSELYQRSLQKRNIIDYFRKYLQ